MENEQLSLNGAVNGELKPLKEPCWIYFYVWFWLSKPIYIGQSKNPKERNHARRGDSLSKFVKAHPGECRFIVLEAKVWDIPEGRWANAIENSLMDLYETHFTFKKGGLNKRRAGDLGFLNLGKIGGKMVHILHPELAKKNLFGRDKNGSTPQQLHPKLYKDLGKKMGNANKLIPGFFQRIGSMGAAAQSLEDKSKGGLIAGGKQVERMREMGREQGRKNAEKGSEYMSSIAKLGASEGGKIGGAKNAVKPGYMTRIGKLGGAKGSAAQPIESKREGGRRGCHTRFHIQRGIVSPACSLCQNSTVLEVR